MAGATLVRSVELYDDLDPLKEAAWGARPRTVRAAALLGVRLYDRRPAPICVGGVYRPRLELGGPLSRCPAPGLECTLILTLTLTLR